MTSPVAVSVVASDMTIRLSCRAGDMLFWFGTDPQTILAGFHPKINDLWYMKDGSSVLITNRSVDLPSWFQLHPTEVSDVLAYKYLQRLQKGWKPSAPCDGPNIWRVRAGDRVAFCGKTRPGLTASADGIFSIYDFQEDALVLGEAPFADVLDVAAFGDKDGPEFGSEELNMGRAATQAVRLLGMPEVISERWSLGR